MIVTQLGVRKEGTFGFPQELIPKLLEKICNKGL